MTLHDFALLCPEDQATVTWKDGAFIAVGDMGRTKVLLYQLNSFYVEVFYNCETGKIERFSSFDSIDMLEPYLAAIDVSDLFPLVRPRDPEPVSLKSRVLKTLQKIFTL